MSEERAYKRNRQKGERLDGYKINISSYDKLELFLMKTRNGSAIYFQEKYDVTNMVKYLDKKNEELKNNLNNDINIKKYNFNMFFMAVIVRTFALRPHLNRFIAGKNLYQRHNIDISYVVKKELVDGAGSTVVKSSFERDSNLDDVAKILAPDIKKGKSDDDDTGDFISILDKLPNFIISFVIYLIDKLIVWGHLPKMIYDIDPMQSSVFVANLGSIGLDNPPIHHLYDRGTTSAFVVFGEVKEEENGRYSLAISVTLDERISDGLYYINSLKLLRNIIENPEKLDKRLKEVPIDK